MRTKTLLLTAALSAAGMATSMAQVYSVNAVGYYNVGITNGLELVANQLKNGGNTYDEVIPGAPDDTVLHKFTTGVGYTSSTKVGPNWFPGGTLAPGEAAFIEAADSAAGTASVDFTLTFVGEVPQGPALTTQIPQGLALRSSQVPQQGALEGALGLTPPAVSDDDIVHTFNQGNLASPYNSYTYVVGLGFSPSDPVIGVGHGFWTEYVANRTWTRSFTVNP